MSHIYTRLHRIFSSTRKTTSSIKSNLNLSPTQKPKPPKIIHGSSVSKKQTMNQGIKDLLNERDSQKLLEKFNSLSKRGFFRQRYNIYEITIHRLALAKKFSLIEQAFETQKSYIAGEGFAARLIYLYGKAGMFEHAHKVFDELPERECERGVKSLNALLSAAANSGKYDKVYELFREIPLKLSIKPNRDCYNTAAHALCMLGLFDDAVSLLDEMEANGLNPSVISFNTLLGAYYGKGKFDEAEKIWERMFRSGVAPDICSYNSKLQGLVNDGKATEAIELIMGLKNKGLIPDVGTYNALILGYCKDDDFDAVKKWYSELLKHGCVPNRLTFSMLVPFLCDKGDYGLAFEVSKKMFKGLCSVDEALLQTVVDGLTKNSMVEEAKILVELGRSNSYFPYDLAMPR